MTTEVRFNGSGVARVFLTPIAPIEQQALKELTEASAKGQTVVLTLDESGAAVLTVKNTKRNEPEQAAE